MKSITVCAHCGKVGFSSRGWGRVCKINAIETTEANVVRDKTGRKVLFYDPNTREVVKARAKLEREGKI